MLFGLPVVMDTRDESVALGDKILLTYQGQDLAVFAVGSKWAPNKPLEALKCYGTTSIEHPAVSMITTERGKFYLGARSFIIDRGAVALNRALSRPTRPLISRKAGGAVV